MSIEICVGPPVYGAQAVDPRAAHVFAHLQAPNVDAYRAVLEAFVRAKEGFRLHLRPDDLAAELARASSRLVIEQDHLPPLLEQLVEWGNLVATADNADVRTVEDFYRARFLYQLSRAGEAAEAALAVFRERLETPGQLQTSALKDIRDFLGELEHELASETPDTACVHQTLSQLFSRFDGLAEQARSFLGSLQRSIDLQASGVDDFLAYKEHLVGYVERFLRELTASSGDIIERLSRVGARGIEHQLLLVADRELGDHLRQDDGARAAVRERWHRRWQGLEGWFIGRDGPAQAQLLRSRTRAAIPALLQALGNLHDKRAQRSDRVADLRTLARWFASGSDEDAHRLFHAAFLLAPTRHLMVDEATLRARAEEPVAPSTSWLDAEPLRIHPRLRTTGRLQAPGQRAVVLDHRLSKARLRERMAREAAQMQAARQLIASGGARRLGEFVLADDGAFDLFLECLGAALARRTDPRATIRCTSADGSLLIVAEPLPGAPWVCLRTGRGELLGPDMLLTISESWALSRENVA